MLNEYWFPLRPHAEQSALWRSSARFRAVIAGRGSGKTELARRFIVRNLPIRKKHPDPKYFYALPTFMQAKRVAWQRIKNLVPKHWLASPPSESELVIRTIFGSELYVVGMDKPQRIEGTQWDGGILDESSDQKPKIFDLTVRPALVERTGWCWRIGVPKRHGIGAADFYAFADRDDVEFFTWTSESILTPEEIADAQHTLSKDDYDEQFLAQRIKQRGLCFHAYDDMLNVRETVYDSTRPLIVGSDFNVDPMSWVIAQDNKQHNELYVHDELFIRNTNTQATLDALHSRFASHQGGWIFHGDATGAARKTSASKSDYLLIKGDERFKPKQVLYPRSNPYVVDRIASCNALMCNALNERRLFVHPRCKHLREDLVNRSWKPGLNEPADSGDIGHITDALGYIIYMRFPITLTTRKSEVISI